MIHQVQQDRPGELLDACTPGAKLNGDLDATCDGVDDDCDGFLDEDFQQTQTACGIGECAQTGVTECQQVAFQVANVVDTCQEAEPATEFDGVTCELNGSPIDCTDPACKDANGDFVCQDSCNNLDEDCDGEVDEDFDVDMNCGTGACAAQGKLFCVVSEGTSEMRNSCNSAAGQAELCGNGIDDDCDGNVDEGFITPDGCDIRAGNCPCSVGVGECQNNAIYVCSANRLGLECAAVAGTPSNEQCNQKDDDCDGDVDEHPSDPSKNLGQPCDVGVGECERSGQYACIALDWACNVTPNEPEAEPNANGTNCNGKDDDCDGIVDEDYNLNTACTVGDTPACEVIGIYTCDANTDARICAAEAKPDTDGDGICNAGDNCPNAPNPNQDDADGDGVGNICDNCANVANEDLDGDGVIDCQDNCVGVPNPADASGSQPDGDTDGVGDACDNNQCLASGTNPSQIDSDGDGVGDLCDNCPNTPNTNQADSDGDGVGNACDNCLTEPNADQLNSDGDNFGNVCDNCPFDLNNDQTDNDIDGVGDGFTQ